jgi:hypothetical protein
MSIYRKRDGYTVVEPKNTWRILEDGRHYREVIVRVHADGLLHLFLIAEDQ